MTNTCVTNGPRLIAACDRGHAIAAMCLKKKCLRVGWKGGRERRRGEWREKERKCLCVSSVCVSASTHGPVIAVVCVEERESAHARERD